MLLAVARMVILPSMLKEVPSIGVRSFNWYRIERLRKFLTLWPSSRTIRNLLCPCAQAYPMIRINMYMLAAVFLTTQALSQPQTMTVEAFESRPYATLEVETGVPRVDFVGLPFRVASGADQRLYSISSTLQLSEYRTGFTPVATALIRKDADSRVIIQVQVGEVRTRHEYPFGQSLAGPVSVTGAPIPVASPVVDIDAQIAVFIERRTEGGVSDVTFTSISFPFSTDTLRPQPPRPPPAPPPPPPAAAADVASPLAAAVVLGTEVRGELPEVVAIQMGKEICTGTLVDPYLVLTIRHCKTAGGHVLVGDDISSPSTERFAIVDVMLANPNKSASALVPANLAERPILILLSDPVIGIALGALAKPGQALSSKVRVAGFGHNNIAASKGAGVKRMAEVKVLSTSCSGRTPDGKPHTTVYADCRSRLDMVAGGSGSDTCKGDSGGPLWSRGPGDVWFVAAITSRGLQGKPCGQGGIYMLLQHWNEWITSMRAQF